MSVARRASVVGLALLLAGCANHYLIHPRQPDARIVTWSAEHTREPLLVRVEGARPTGLGPFPTVIVHPEGGGTARDMRGVIWDLAARGYLALAADYRRLIDGKYRWSLFAWRSPADVKAIVDIAREYPEIDQGRIGLLGFSQGGVFSLLIAAHTPERVQAVVSYYPVTDFPSWLALERRSGLQRIAFRFVRWFFRRESGAESEAEFERMLHEASAYYVAESIRAPVLLVHGERDTTASVEESRRMAERLEAAGKTVSLLVVPDGRHIFNFRDRAQAAIAWDATVAWLDRYVALDTAASPRWHRVATAPRFSWIEPRARPNSAAGVSAADTPSWEVPLQLGGQRLFVRGKLDWKAADPLAPASISSLH